MHSWLCRVTSCHQDSDSSHSLQAWGSLCRVKRTPSYRKDRDDSHAGQTGVLQLIPDTGVSRKPAWSPLLCTHTCELQGHVKRADTVALLVSHPQFPGGTDTRVPCHPQFPCHQNRLTYDFMSLMGIKEMTNMSALPLARTKRKMPST